MSEDNGKRSLNGLAVGVDITASRTRVTLVVSADGRTHSFVFPASTARYFSRALAEAADEVDEANGVQGGDDAGG